MATKTRFTAREIIRALIFFSLLPAALFLAAGTLNWLPGWLFTAIFVLATLLSRVAMLVKTPDLAKERASMGRIAGAKQWDVFYSLVSGLLGPLAILVTAGLDRRFGWSPQMPTAVWVTALIVVAAGYSVATWAMLVNRFFSGVVRIQQDRGHTVVEDGPYRVIRHPGYAGGMAGALGAALGLGSLWALIPAAATVAVMVGRTAREDAALQAELPGYTDYSRRTRYRLLPGIW